ncbi:MBL fold metallo-hydrolase [Azomonas macrocytogenes]|uniref:Glyoxylase-like metal-dependent hydrolase (Beta-lactamase superfamily II) n=1 Tax=Azomonas macrocytogenes TaxID=69962 RepID=A0A839T3C6_AZOMA|nr:MBL fold metallo-hydrolase [Azomonas macrocytogenes]MBB3103509.1 glyoxylase-like metal-dependent hydrolase (beta-lactamase superfamily II) [Azomonas macrocytogenes]
MQPQVDSFFDTVTHTYSYIVTDPATRQCAIIDPVLDYDAAAGRISHAGADRLIAHVREHGLRLQWLLETHVHADHLSAAVYIKRELGGELAIGARITEVQQIFGQLFNAGSGFATDGHQFGRLFHDGEQFQIGSLTAQVIHTPGHTPACVTYLISNTGFVGDTLFMPDYGTARCDFPGGDARSLYRSIRKLFELPGATRLFMCHDYKAPGREEFLNQTTIAEQRAGNVHVHDGVSEDDFVAMRTARDAKLSMPNLLLPSIQVNMRAGKLPPAEDNGRHYLKIPLSGF